ncbi:radical SAM/SPASM domain-containing protein [Anaerocolumna sp.]|uniref:radical SAM/SPASM domain-containing protein n=1 Tax=Anaerocolumna sp. TaxID=2041569 RepID=UPI0028AF8B58|nr:radical SAM protein [Anaerocolumna sp.]
MQTLEEQMLMIKNGEVIAPFLVELHLTNACNHNCKWCIYSDIRKGDNSFITYEKAKKLVKSIKNTGCESIVFSGGGDPLTHKNVEDIIKYAYTLGMEIILITNGGCLNRCNINKLSEHISLLRISVDSYDDMSYNSIHHPKSHSETFSSLSESIKEFVRVKNKTKVILSYILDNESIIGLSKFVHKAIELQVDGIDIKTEHNLTYTNKKMLIKKAHEYLEDINVESMEVKFDSVKRRKKFVENLWVGLCYTCIIEANGNIYPCCHTIEDDYLIGNVNDESFENIWYGKRHKDMVKEYYAKKQSCPTCTDSSTSKMICRIINA